MRPQRSRIRSLEASVPESADAPPTPRTPVTRIVQQTAALLVFIDVHRTATDRDRKEGSKKLPKLTLQKGWPQLTICEPDHRLPYPQRGSLGVRSGRGRPTPRNAKRSPIGSD